MRVEQAFQACVKGPGFESGFSPRETSAGQKKERNGRLRERSENGIHAFIDNYLKPKQRPLIFSPWHPWASRRRQDLLDLLDRLTPKSSN